MLTVPEYIILTQTTMSMPTTTKAELLGQWKNPADVLSLLLLIGGDIVQKAIAQMVGYHFQPLSPRQRKVVQDAADGGEIRLQPFNSISLTPVAFSFGWIAFGFSQLMSVVGDGRLLPPPEQSAIVVNCANGFQRSNSSWMLDRLLRDHEIRNPVNEGKDSIRVDLFEVGPLQWPRPDHIWWLGWVTIFAELGIVTIPWVVDSDWGPMLIVLSGTLLAASTCYLPQWTKEKWAGRLLSKDQVLCLTRGNGHKHVMVLIGSKGSPDLETFATARGSPCSETPYVTVLLAILWIFLLISVIGLKDNAWYIVGAGGLGMIHNVLAAGATRSSSTTGLQLSIFKRMPTITGKSTDFEDDINAEVDLNQASQDVLPLKEWVGPQKAKRNLMPAWLTSMKSEDGVPEWLEPVQTTKKIIRVHGALKELEKWVPGAGLAMIKVFFPTRLEYDDGNIRDNINKKFWKRAWQTVRVRRQAEQARRHARADVISEARSV